MESIFVEGSKQANSYLYINEVKISEEDAPYAGTSWKYTFEYPELGVNGLKIAIEDESGNKSPTVTYSYIYESEHVEAIPIVGEDLLTGNVLVSVRNKQNIDFSPIYGIDPETGKSVIVRAFIKVK